MGVRYFIVNRRKHSVQYKKLIMPQHESFSCLESWGNSVTKQDKAAVLAHYAEGGTLWPTLSNRIREDPDAIGDYFDLFLAKIAGTNNVEWNQNVCQVVSETNCMWSGVYTFHLKAGATKARYSYLLVKNGDKWQIVHHHSSLMPEN